MTENTGKVSRLRRGWLYLRYRLKRPRVQRATHALMRETRGKQ